MSRQCDKRIMILERELETLEKELKVERELEMEQVGNQEEGQK